MGAKEEYPRYNKRLSRDNRDPEPIPTLFPYLPPPPEMLEMTGSQTLLPVDVPKIGSSLPYQPPELLFNEIHKLSRNPARSYVGQLTPNQRGGEQLGEGGGVMVNSRQ